MTEGTMTLTDDVALVTGAGRGIGKAIAGLLARSGAAVAVNDCDPATAEATCRELVDRGHRAAAFVADVADQDAVNDMVDDCVRQLGDISVLVNNAAAPAELVPFVETTLAVQRAEMVTLLGVLHCTRSVLPSMIEKRRGRIVNISSVSGRSGAPGRAIYSGANAGIEGFSRALSREVGRCGVRVNCVSPGATDSPRFKARAPEVRRNHRRIISLDRFAEPEEIAEAVLFLVGERSSYVTGAVIDVDGGFAGYLPDKDDA